MTETERQQTPPSVHVDNRERRRRERSRWRIAFLLSAAVHVLIFLFGPAGWIPPSPFSAAGPRAGDDQAAQGQLQAVALSSAPPDAAVPPPTPVPDVEIEPPEEIEIEPEALPEIEPDLPDLPDPGVGSTTGTDDQDQGTTGLPEATGAGDGGTSDEGLFRTTMPIPRGVIMPPMDTPSNVDEDRIEVWLFIDAEGRVVPDSTRLAPETRNRDYNEELKEKANTWTFRPALEAGEPVAAWFTWVVEH